MALWQSIVLIVSGLGLLIWAADRLVMAASSLASRHGVSPLLIGLLIVGFGTSAPEMFISAMSSLNRESGIAVGNALGSNIANIGLVLGVAALIAPLQVPASVLKREYPVLLLVTAGTCLLMLNGAISRLDGAILLAALLGLVALLLWVSRRKPEVAEAVVGDDLPETSLRTKPALLWLGLSLLLLPLSSQMLVTGASSVAMLMGVDPVVIGLSVVAIGTSLPELAAAVASAVRREHELIVGNIIGSNVFNLLAVLGIAGMVRPLELAPALMSRDYLWMSVFTLVLVALVQPWRRPLQLGRPAGCLLLAGFVGYMVLLAQSEILA